MSSFSTSCSEDMSEIHEQSLSEIYDQFTSFTDLYEYILSITNESEKNVHELKLPQYMDYLFKMNNLYTNWNTSTEITEDMIEILLHLEIELKNIYSSNAKLKQSTKQLIQKEIEIIDSLAEKFGFVFNSTIKQNELSERTDKNLIPDDKVHCLDISMQLMSILTKGESLANEHNNVVFNHPKCQPANKTLKSNNYYGLDRLGIVIRREFFNSKSKPFSWKYIENTTTPISYFYDPILNDEENVNQILSRQYQLQPSAFTKPSGVIYKIYSHDPELYQRYVNFMTSKLK